jgi:RNA polymerase sigma factor (sigma-70 family)
MPHPALSAAVARVGRSATRTADPTPGLSDGRLLARFVQTRDEPVFAELVRRLGPMVLGVCRRVSGDHHLADDAFQAAFLVLARRAADVRPKEAVRGWLYGVAVRTAREARTVSARRRTRELPVPAVPDRPADAPEAPDADALRMLDEEVAALPDHLRAAVALCELDGISRKDAAARLGVAEGTLSSRLAKARTVLAARLKKRGVALTAAGLGWALGQLASAAVPARLLLHTSALSTATGPVPPQVAALSTGVFRTMFLHKLALTAGAALVLGALVALARPGATAQEPARQPAPGAPTTKAADERKPAPAKKAGPGTLLLVREGSFQALTPDGKVRATFAAPERTGVAGMGCLSPDGTRAAVVVTGETPPAIEPPADGWPFKVVVQALDKADARKVVDMPSNWLTLNWAADGKRVVVGKHPDRDRGKNVETLLLDPDTGKTSPLDLPAGVWVLDCGRDGKAFLVAFDAKKTAKLGIATLGDATVRELAEVPNWPPGSVTGRLSPDGSKVLYTAADPARKDAHKWGVSQRPYLLDVRTKKSEPLAEFPENGRATGIAWSPDGKRLAYAWTQLHADFLKKDRVTGEDARVETEAFLIVADADGQNPRTVATDKGPWATNMVYGAIDWR